MTLTPLITQFIGNKMLKCFLWQKYKFRTKTYRNANTMKLFSYNLYRAGSL